MGKDVYAMHDPSALCRGSAQSEKNEIPPFYRFVSIYQNYLNSTRDYGDGVQRGMIEVHILQIICRHPGITVGQVAMQWGRTKGSASQNATKLEKQGLIERARLAGNAKEVHLYPTEAGLAVNRLHEDYDKKNEGLFASRLLKECTMEELETFTRVLDIYSNLFEEDLAAGE